MAAASYTFRNYLSTDFENLVSFFQKELPSHLSTPQWVTDWLSWPGFTPGKDLFIVEIDNTIAGYICVRPELGIDRVVLGCRLGSDHRRKGLAVILLNCALNRARELGAAVAHVDVMADNSVARKALEKDGFEVVRKYYQLKIQLNKVDWEEAEETSQGCRHLMPGEEAALADIQNRSFADHWGYNPNTSETIAFLINRDQSSPEDIVITCEEDNIVGFCRTELSGNDEGRILMIGTDPDYRGKGIGKKSLLAGLIYLRSKNIHTVYLTVDTANETAITLYKSVGFENNNILMTYEKTVDRD